MKIEFHNEWQEWRIKTMKQFSVIDFHIGEYDPHQREYKGDWHGELALLGFRLLVRVYKT
jgi:hypothetical protein